jgi:hypothetical protein
MVSSDDDMRPYALVEGSPESLGRSEISRGRLHKTGTNGYLHKSFDLLTSFKDVLGKRVSEVPGNYESGELLRDTAMDLETNVSTEFAAENSLLLEVGSVSKGAVIKIAQSFRTGTNDIDALDFVNMYLNDEQQHHADLHRLNDVYVLELLPVSRGPPIDRRDAYPPLVGVPSGVWSRWRRFFLALHLRCAHLLGARNFSSSSEAG